MNEEGETARHPGYQLVADLFRAGLAATAGDRCVADFLARHDAGGPASVIALGKAADAMAAGAITALGDRLRRGLLVTRRGHLTSRLQDDLRFTCLETGHPLPDRHSLAAGDRLLRFLAETPYGERLLFLISGGTSSLVEVPDASVDLEQLRRLNAWLLGSGLDIAAMNRIRCAVSRIKCGRLLGAIGAHPATVLLISDVPGDDPAIIGSGPLMPPAHRIALPHDLPDWIRRLLAPCDRDWELRYGNRRVPHHVIARLRNALEASARHARDAGLQVGIVDSALHGEAGVAARRIAGFLDRAAPGVWLWGGETTVRLPERPGQGGRNQQLALAAALELVDRDDWVLLAAGTDGSDGPGEVAGASVDGGTIRRGGGRRAALDALQQADAGRFLRASGDLLVTGPTGTNVMDLMIGLKTG